ncbi:MAG TPA: hypothetical protein VJ770_13135 [Stellaceae bacterium]|nr:hypothetical protein [Stellaceae bacterium]
MNKQSRNKASPQPNEGEGNRSAAPQYNEAQQRFVQSGKVADKARESGERRELERAEAIGRRHIAEEDPEVTRPYTRKKR